MATRRQPEAGIRPVKWPEFYPWFARNFKRGEHVVIFGSTGSGKSVLGTRIVALRDRVVILDGKGGDDPSLAIPGFRKITSWPPARDSELYRMMTGRDRLPMRLHLAPPMHDLRRDAPYMRAQFQAALEDLFGRKGHRVFDLYVDEMQIVADPTEGMGLKRYIGPLLRTKRYDNMSVISATQFPTWIGKSTYRETTHRFFFPIADEDSQKSLGMMTGQRQRVIPILNGLPEFHFLYQHRRFGFVTSKVEA